MNLISVLVLSLLLASPSAFARKAKSAGQTPKVPEQHRAIIDHCHDGDTCTAFLDDPKTGKPGAVKMKIRFSGIDAPEKKQSQGLSAQKFLEARLKDKLVRLECLGKSFDRHTCVVFLGDENINRWMVAEGWAWDSPKYSKGEFKALQAAAQVAKKGMWGQAEADAQVSPFCYRHKKNKACRQSLLFNP